VLIKHKMKQIFTIEDFNKAFMDLKLKPYGIYVTPEMDEVMKEFAKEYYESVTGKKWSDLK
jgi:hypothetical protein